MSRILYALPLLAALGWGLPALAQSVPAIADSDGSGDWSLAELQAAFPDLTAEGFAAIDSNGNGAVDQAELVSALADGVLPAPSGG